MKYEYRSIHKNICTQKIQKDHGIEMVTIFFALKKKPHNKQMNVLPCLLIISKNKNVERRNTGKKFHERIAKCCLC